jgi:hypothetical protein
MMIARWHIEARFGHKQTVIDMLKRWNEEIGSQIGWTKDNLRIVTGSIGALESTIESEVMIADLTELNNSFEKLGAIEAHKAWSEEIEPYVVSGTTHWQIFRVV